jgi:flavin-dependent dehydrogenase
MKDKVYDIIIIGAGPAGASLAYFLSDSDLRIALIEKKKYADHPVRCAELVPKALKMLYKDKIKGINNEISHMETYIEGKLSNVSASPGYILDRHIFIDFLIKEFLKRDGNYLSPASFVNATYPDTDKINDGCGPLKKYVAIEDAKSNNFGKKQVLTVRIRQDDKIISLKTKIIAGADGPLSLIAGIMNPLQQNKYLLQENQETKSRSLTGFKEAHYREDSFLIGLQENIIKKKDYECHAKIFFYPFISGGYGWVFPKKDSLNVGVAVNVSTSKESSLKSIYLRFKNELVKKEVIERSEYINTTISGLIPVGGIRNQLVKNNIVLIGDAAGLCNPITGTGIYNSALSAKITAVTVKKAIESDSIEALKEAEKDICDYFKTSIDHALKKRQILEENKSDHDFENLVKKTWVSFKDYWHER